MKTIKFFDSTLRDGSHAVKHQISLESIAEYCKKVDGSGLYTVIVGHGNGLGASSLQVGLSAHSDLEMLKTARKNLRHTRLGAFMIPGFGGIRDDLAPALKTGVDLVCIGIHCTEADITAQHIEYVAAQGKEVYGVLMMYHMAGKERLLEEAKKMQSYGAMGVIFMDSAGSSTPDMVREVVGYISTNLEIPVGFHAHNNLSMAVANSLTAIEAGAGIIDGTTRGFGAGAGNCQLEALIALMQKIGMETGVDLYKVLDASDEVVKAMMLKPQETDAVSIVSGLAGVFSGFSPHVRKAAEKYGVDARDIFMELGRRKVVAGQEDLIIGVAAELKKIYDQRKN
ncbi:MAG: 4-hydroxy-2-oxovalerate aldolase [Patescibacteria group bacterium]